MDILESLINHLRRLTRRREVRSAEQLLKELAAEHAEFNYRLDFTTLTWYLRNAKGDIVSIPEERLQTVRGEQSVRRFSEGGRV